MGMTLTPTGKQSLIDGGIDLDTHTIKVALLDLATADVAIKAITAATNATPIVITAAAHGFASNDWVLIGGVLGNLAANGVWRITVVDANSFSLQDPVSGGNVVGSGVYTSGGYVVCLGPSAAGDRLDDYSAAFVGTPQTLTAPTVAGGTFDAADPSFPAVTGASVEALLFYKDTGVETTGIPFLINDGRQIVTAAAQAAAAATSIAVERLAAGIPNGSVLVFSNGASATLSALANAGDRTLTVTALAAIITAGSRADAPVTSSGLPVTPNGGSINVQLSSAGIFSL